MLHSIHSRRLLCIFLVHYAQVVLHIGHGPMTRHLKKKLKEMMYLHSLQPGIPPQSNRVLHQKPP